MTIFVNAEPLHQGADFAVWRGEDIPPGVMRGPLWGCTENARDHAIARGLYKKAVPQTTNDLAISRKHGWVAAVSSTQMQCAQRSKEIMREILERELFTVTGSPQPRQQPHNASEQIRITDRILAVGMGAAWGECWPHKPSDQERAAWSRELRRLTAASEERERNRVLVDLEFEPWE